MKKINYMTQDHSQQTLTEFIDILKARGLSPEDQEKTITKLNEAIVLNLVNRLDDILSSEQRNLLIASEPKQIGDLLEFYGTIIPKAQLQESVKLATESVIEKFLSKI